MSKFNTNVTEEAVSAVNEFARAFTRLLKLSSADWVVALHNTDDEYCIHSYVTGGTEAHNAAQVHVADTQHRHDFFLVTEAPLFDALRRRNRNVILQATDGLEDDGSLSVLCHRQSIRYVNIEACSRSLATQQGMLSDLFDVLPNCSA